MSARPMIQRPGEAVAAGGDARTSLPDGTRALAGAILAGRPAVSGPRLVVVKGPAAGIALALHDGAILGRGRDAALKLGDSLASRCHAVFTIRGGRARLRDLSSKNGSTVNGRRIGRSLVVLDPGDALSVGESVLVYEEGDPAAPPEEVTCASPPLVGAPAPQDRFRRVAARAALGMATLALVALAVTLALAADGWP